MKHVIYLSGIIAIMATACGIQKRIHRRNLYSTVSTKGEMSSGPEKPNLQPYANTAIDSLVLELPTETTPLGDSKEVDPAKMSMDMTIVGHSTPENTCLSNHVRTDELNQFDGSENQHVKDKENTPKKKIAISSIIGFTFGIGSFIALIAHYQEFWVAGKGSAALFRATGTGIAVLALLATILCIIAAVRISRNTSVYKYKWIAIVGIVLSSVAFSIAAMLALSFL